MAQTKSQQIQTFLRTIGNDIKLYRQLLPLLQTQRSLYIKFDSASLTANVQQQMPILNQLHQSAQLRTQCMKNLGLSNSDHGVQALLKVLPNPLRTQATQQWQQLHLLVEQCQHYNQMNGRSSATFHEMLAQIVQPEQHTYQEHIYQEQSFNAPL